MASAHNSSDPAPTCQTMASVQISSDPAPERQTMALEHDSLSPGRKCQENVSHGDKISTTSNELDLLFSLMFGELLNGSSKTMASAHNSFDPAHTCQTMASAHNSSDPAHTCQTMASAHNSFDPAHTCQTMASAHNSSDPAHTCQTMASAHNSSDPAHTCQTMVSARNSFDPAHTCQKMASVQITSDPAPECQTMVLKHNNLSPRRKCQENVSHGDKTVTTSNELDLLFSLMFDELLNGSSKVVSKSFVVSAADAPNERQQPITPLNNHTTPAPTCQTLNIAPTVISYENINQAEPHAENNQVADDEFINIFSTPVQDQGETLSRHVDSSNMHTFYQCYPSEHRWTKDHPSEQVIGNPSQSIRTRRQLELDAEMYMFALTVSRTEPKNIKEEMANSAWIESMQEELHQFDRLDVWELVDRPLCTNVINL
nr:Gag-Pol polyprotein [Tanacetum cinerariifolium]